MSEELFYYCERCKKEVPRAVAVCDGCRKRFRNERVYTIVKIEELKARDAQKEETAGTDEGGKIAQQSQTGQAHQTQGVVQLKCPICGMTYDENHSICDTCGMPLVMTYEPVVVPEENVDREMIFGDVIEYPAWEIKVRRFMNNQAYEGNTFVVNRSIMPVGRRFLVLNHIFHSDMRIANAMINVVSADNGFLIVENGELFIQYDTTKRHDKGTVKSRIKVKGQTMTEQERIKLAVGDVITLGSDEQSSMDYCVEMEIVGLENSAARQMNFARLKEDLAREVRAGISSELGEVKQMQRQTYDMVAETAEHVRKLVTDLDITKFASTDDYLEAAEECERQYEGKKLSKEEYIDNFLEDYPRKQEFLASLSEAQKEYLYYAAFYESMARLHPEADVDYSATFIYIGKLLENFANTVMRPFLLTFGRSRLEEIRNRKGVKCKLKNLSLTLGEVTRSFVDNVRGQKIGIESIILPIARAYTQNTQLTAEAEIFAQMEKAFVDCDNAREYRNSAAHCSLEAILASDLKRISKEEYLQAKKNVIESDFIINIFDYYSKTIKEQKRA